MAYLENGIFCSVNEYEAGVERRVHETALEADELYTLALRLENSSNKAAKIAARPFDVIQVTGKAVVGLAMLDTKLNPQAMATVDIVDGFARDILGVHVMDTASGDRYEILEGYLKDYFEDQFRNLLEQSEELSLV